MAEVRVRGLGVQLLDGLFRLTDQEVRRQRLAGRGIPVLPRLLKGCN